jgi:hypothetical protein
LDPQPFSRATTAGSLVNSTIKEPKNFWPVLTLVNGKLRKSTTQGSVERCNGDVENVIKKHMVDSKTKKWAAALPRIQFQKNTALDIGIGNSPYEMMSGTAFKSTILPGVPKEFYNKLRIESDLARFVEAGDVKYNDNLDRLTEEEDESKAVETTDKANVAT